MDNEQMQEAREAAKLFSSLDEKIRDKLLNGVKCLVFLQDLADLNDAERAIKAAQVPA